MSEWVPLIQAVDGSWIVPYWNDVTDMVAWEESWVMKSIWHRGLWDVVWPSRSIILSNVIGDDS